MADMNSIFKRPSVKETDEDLLKQQEEFLKAAGKNIPPKVESPNKPETSFNIIGNVVEKNRDPLPIIAGIKSNTEAFPQVFRVDSLNVNMKAKKKSLFALKLEEKAKEKKIEVIEEPMQVELPVEVNEEVAKVHQENVDKIKHMSEEELLAEKKSLEGLLSPEVLTFLKNRGAKKKVVPAVEDPSPNAPTINMDEIRENLLKTVDKEWMEMDQIEPEKLKWIGDIPDANSLEPDQPYSARFDFSGNLLPFKADIDVRTSLHHHGDEPERPGYTIQELYQLCRSTVLQQRIIALNTLANIIRKTKMGYYDQCFDGVLLKKLVESDVFFLLRFAMDDRTVTPAAINCLNEFFTCRSDEVCLDRLLNITEEDEEPTLFIPFEIDTDTEEEELKDELIIAQDIVKGILRTDILIRFNYILREFAPDEVAKSKIFETLIRICRHSKESCEKVFNSPGLIQYVFENLSSEDSFHQSVKLLRVIVTSSKELAVNLMNRHSFSFILRFIDMDKPAFKLKLECLALYKALLRYSLMIDDLLSFTPCLIRLLWFYFENVNVNHGRFDFELFASIVSLLNTAQSIKIAIDQHYISVIQQCLVKWITQLPNLAVCNYSVAKALGSAFRFLVLKYSFFGVDTNDVNYLKSLGEKLVYFLSSEIFLKLSKELRLYSHLLKVQHLTRDPDNLPSLLAVYANGSDYLRIVNDSSTLPLFLSLTNFLSKFYDISHDSKPLLELFVAAVDDFLNRILATKPNSTWFTRYEVKLLFGIIDLLHKLSSANLLQISFQTMPFFRYDDPLFLKVIFFIFDSNVWPKNLCNFYVQTLEEDRPKTLNYDCKTISTTWMYDPISKNALDILQFVSKIISEYPTNLRNVSHTLRFYRLCLVFLNDNNVFDADIKAYLQICFDDIVKNIDKIDLNIRVDDKKSFYDLYTEFVIQYAAISYGDALFAKFVLLPLTQKFDISFRKLLWSEYMHVLRVITLPQNVDNFIPFDTFLTPIETDESLLVIYLNAISKNVLIESRNGFIYSVALENIRRFLRSPEKDARLSSFLFKRINELSNEELKKTLLS